MKELRKSISQLANEELERANRKFSPFHSAHEGYATIKEEIEEAADESQRVHENFEQLWESIKANKPSRSSALLLQCYVEAQAAELIQVAAMAQKFLDFMGEDKGE